LSRRTDESGLVLQMLVLRLAELPRLKSIEQALSGLPVDATGPSLSAAPPAPSAVREGGRSREEGPRILSLVTVETEPEESPRPQPVTGDAAGTRRFTDLLGSRRRVTAAKVSLAEATNVEGDELVLRFGIDRAAAKEALEDPPTRKLLSDVATEAFGRPMRVTLKTGPPADGDLGKAAQEVPRATIARERATTRAETDPVVRSAMELFRAELSEVKEED
jgi:hypothetical protein